MYGNPYMNIYNPQANIDKLNEQINNLEKMKAQLQQPMQPSINQTFQLSNSPSGIKYANNIEEVEKDIVISDTPFFSKDMSVLWIKNIKGEIKTYELTELIQKDDKDLLISSLQMQIEELRKEIKENAKPVVIDANESSEDEKPTNVSISRTSKKK